MTEVHSKVLDRSINVDRLIGHIKGEEPGPTIIFIAGIHGNEALGVFALEKVLRELRDNQVTVKGNIYAISGNLPALEKSERFIEQDLNRLWTSENIPHLLNGKSDLNNTEVVQQKEIFQCLKNILDTEKGPFYFMDLHTVSSASIPFLTVNDSLLNRKFTSQYPVPIILGIEEYLDGPLLSYVNELGYVAFGFEGGQHDDPASFENHVAFTSLSLVFSGIIDKASIDYYHYLEVLAKTSVSTREIYEIYFRYKIKEGEQFRMNPGFVNFQKIPKGIEVAKSEGKPISTTKSGILFMPAYQSQGNDGFFAIRSVPRIFLNLSTFFRKVKMDKLFTLLPGVRWASDKKEAIIVDKRIARFLSKQIFHLMGYRSKRIDRTHIFMKNREVASREAEYESANWMN